MFNSHITLHIHIIIQFYRGGNWGREKVQHQMPNSLHIHPGFELIQRVAGYKGCAYHTENSTNLTQRVKIPVFWNVLF